ncbi:MAG: hypothetical protein ACE5F9_10010, partial [Phycisphaerae bacterium]
DQSGWNLLQLWCDPTQWLAGGWFFQHVELCNGFPPPGGQTAAYRRSLAEFIGEQEFFIEWRVQTDADRSEIPWGGGVSFSVWSNGPVNYRFTIASDRAELNRDNLLPIILVDIEPGVPHTYRLELHADALYEWYIDGQLVDFGLPEGAYPSVNPNINMVAKAAFLENTSQWDYARWGTLPQPGSGDFDSNGLVDQADVFFFLDCLLGPDGAGPGCRWADMNNDGTADGQDISLFVGALLAG